MRFNTRLLVSTVVVAMSIGLASCGPREESADEFDFTIQLESGNKQITLGSTDKVKILDNGVAVDGGPLYTYTSSNTGVATIDEKGLISTVSVGSFVITVEETKTSTRQKLTVPVVADAEAASGGFNYASASGAEAIATRTEILGKLEKYAMDSHLTGITLFENGGYVKYSERAYTGLPTTNYITGYGFGMLSEGRLDSDLEKETNPDYKRFYHSAISQDSLTINAYNATGSQVSDLNGYISSSFWGTKMNADKNGYEWYPVLAKDKVGGSAQLRPTHVEPDNELGLYKTWRIYVKTGAEDGLKYRTASEARATFNNRNVTIEDYEFAIKFLLTGSNKMKRGAEMAGDATYGIKGAQNYYNNTKSVTDVNAVDAAWTNAKANGLGLTTGTDTNGSYIQFELLNPIDDFTAMYTLSSNLYSPLPRDFILDISEDGTYASGATRYGSFNSGGNDAIIDYTICCGPYYLSRWYKKQAIVFTRNDNWFEYSPTGTRYQIPGVHLRVIDTSSNSEAVWQAFENGEVDSAGVPISQISAQQGQPRVLKTKGDSTFKLNVNSASKEYWNYLFGENGKINKGSNWELKPWMSNDNFLKGLFHSINRKEFADKRGVQPSINYFSDSYLSDPENGISYNSTSKHKEAVSSYQVYSKDESGNIIDNYGYSKDKAISYFKTAVSQLVAAGDIKKGTKSKPSEIHISIEWMYQTDVREYGEDISKYFTDAFNDNSVSNGTVKLVVDQHAVTNWEDVYNEYMMKGQFDLAFGAISGNTYNPLNFLEVLKSDNSSGFTLNWGPDTSKVDAKNPLIYDGKAWSFDALWEVADHGGIVENGSIVKSVKSAYMETPKTLTGSDTNDLTDGASVVIPVTFINVPGTSFSLSQEEGAKIQLYVFGGGSYDLTYTLNGTTATVTIPKALANEINEKIREVNKLREEDGNKDYAKYERVFTLGNYGRFWVVEAYYNFAIAGGSPSQNYVVIEKNAESHDFDN